VGSDSTSSADTGEAVVTEPYNTQELTTFNGQLLKVVDRDDESGWLWCRSDDGARGWVPTRTLDEIVTGETENESP
jgi:Variant SH3 domain